MKSFLSFFRERPATFVYAVKKVTFTSILVAATITTTFTVNAADVIKSNNNDVTVSNTKVLNKKSIAEHPTDFTKSKYTIDQLPVLHAEPQHATATKRITARYTQSHYKKFDFDSNFSKAIFNRYLESLDYNHLFFLQEDIDSFSKWQDQLNEQFKNGETTAAFAIYNLYLKRRYQRYQYALSLLDKPMSFDGDDEILSDRHEEAYAKTDDELNKLWYQRVKYDELNLTLAKKDWEHIQKTLSNRYNNAIRYLIQSKNEDVISVYFNAFSHQIDPHTDYFSPKAADQFESEMNLSLEGIGAVLQTEDDYATIRSVVPGGPAAKSKRLGPGDRIIGVAQDKEEMVDVVGWRLDDIVELIKGKKGTKVRLEILPKGKVDGSYQITIIREKIKLEDSAAKITIVKKDNGNIAVLTIPSFYLGLAKDTKKLISSLKDKRISGIVIDLRNDGGGALSEAIALTSLFINGPVVQVRDSYNRVTVNNSDDKEISYTGPLTVLINRYSASASEIFAAAMQDYGRALIIGENSYGKGTVQQMMPLNKMFDFYSNKMGYIKFTIQKFYRINGGSTQNLGVKPDIAFPTTIDPKDSGESSEKTALPWDKITPSDYKPVADLTSFIAPLTENSAQRIEHNIQFKFIAEAYLRYEKLKKEKMISLNKAKRSVERQADEQRSLDQINQNQKSLNKPAFKSYDKVPKDYQAPDAYLIEAENITLDFAKAIKK